jgi:predicted GTPase
VAAACPGQVMRFALRPEPAEELPGGARVALFSTGPAHPEGIEPVVSSPNLARRRALAADLDRASAEGCDVYLTELKAAAIDTVAARAAREGARVVFVRNRPVGVDGDLDRALLGVWADA